MTRHFFLFIIPHIELLCELFREIKSTSWTIQLAKHFTASAPSNIWRYPKHLQICFQYWERSDIYCNFTSDWSYIMRIFEIPNTWCTSFIIEGMLLDWDHPHFGITLTNRRHLTITAHLIYSQPGILLGYVILVEIVE